MFFPLNFSIASFICKLDFLGQLLNVVFLKFLFLCMPLYSALFSKTLNFSLSLSYLLFFPKSTCSLNVPLFCNYLFFHRNSTFTYLSEHNIAFPPNSIQPSILCLSQDVRFLSFIILIFVCYLRDFPQLTGDL